MLRNALVWAGQVKCFDLVPYSSLLQRVEQVVLVFEKIAWVLRGRGVLHLAVLKNRVIGCDVGRLAESGCLMLWQLLGPCLVRLIEIILGTPRRFLAV